MADFRGKEESPEANEAGAVLWQRHSGGLEAKGGGVRALAF